MNDQYEKLHNLILCVMHDLVFGGCGLRGDPQEKLLRIWYEQYQESVENTVKEAVLLPPTPAGKPREEE